MIIFTISNIKVGIFRLFILFFALGVLCFGLPSFYTALTASSEKEDDLKELSEPLRVENEVDPENLSAWFNALPSD